MFRLFSRNAALRSYRMRSRPEPAPARPTVSAWATWPTVALPRPGRAGWLTPARANGGRW
ncbi:hypothetical protein [Micromonospora endolithica]|uniref:hypothetical protein n=1 Tax=Micromonospora endolithica TaxID=230091 RepID=UPI0011AD6A5C|nr:hypothetical protein [Micromonospora endolithica]TWJ25025.1 hypothetical protein JD76_05185 [Micromonospora endolithica]